MTSLVFRDLILESFNIKCECTLTTLYLHVICLVGIVIYPSKGVDSCIPFTTAFKPLKNGGYHAFFLFYQALKLA
jgi:hypothetical protein